MTLAPGFYPASEISMSIYLADPCVVPSLSSGAAHRIVTRSPAHVWADHPRLGGRTQIDSNASDIGTLAHDMLLGGEGKICVIDPTQYRSKPTKDNPEGSVPAGWTNTAIRAARDEARSNGLTPVLIGDVSGARHMVKAAQDFIANSELAGVWRDGAGETTMIWQEDETWFRARPDWINHEERVMLHYKTTRASASPEPFIRGILTGIGYDVSMAFYRRGFEHLTKQQDFLHVILVQEQMPPHACSLITLDPASWAIADGKVEQAVLLWEHAMRSGTWPAYDARIHSAAPTPWALAQAEELAMQGDVSEGGV